LNSRMGMLVSAGCGVLLSGSSGVFVEALLYYQMRLPVFVIIIPCMACTCACRIQAGGKMRAPSKTQLPGV
jgi:hypothetical protein